MAKYVERKDFEKLRAAVGVMPIRVRARDEAVENVEGKTGASSSGSIQLMTSGMAKCSMGVVALTQVKGAESASEVPEAVQFS